MTTRATTGLRPAAILVAVVVLLVATVGAVIIGSAPDETPTPIASPTPVAVEPLPTAGARLERGQRYTVGLVAPGSDPEAVDRGDAEIAVDLAFTIEISRDWIVDYPIGTCCWYVMPLAGRSSIRYEPVSNVYADACDGDSLLDPPIGPTVDDLVTALEEQASTELSDPVDVTVGGYPGTRFEMRPASSLPEFCMKDGPYPVLRFWPDLAGDPVVGMVDKGEEDDRPTIYVLDVQGNRVVFRINHWGGSLPEQAIEEVMASMEF